MVDWLDLFARRKGNVEASKSEVEDFGTGELKEGARLSELSIRGSPVKLRMDGRENAMAEAHEDIRCSPGTRDSLKAECRYLGPKKLRCHCTDGSCRV